MTATRIWFVIRLVATAGILAVLAWKVDFSPVFERARSFQWSWYLLGLAVMLVYIAVQSVILKVLLASRGQHVRFLSVVCMLFVSAFFGLFLPGGVGADVALCYALFRAAVNKEVVLSCIAFARVATLVGMVAIAFVASLMPGGALPGLETASFVALVVLVVGYVIFAVSWKKMAGNLARRQPTGSLPDRVVRFGFRTLDVLAEFWHDRRTLYRVIPLVLLVSLMRVAMDYISSHALGLAIPAIDFFLFAAAVNMVAAIPLTLSGLGVREGAYAYLFSMAGVTAGDAVAISLTSFSFTVLVAVTGSVIYVVSGVRAGARKAGDR